MNDYCLSTERTFSVSRHLSDIGNSDFSFHSVEIIGYCMYSSPNVYPYDPSLPLEIGWLTIIERRWSKLGLVITSKCCLGDRWE